MFVEMHDRLTAADRHTASSRPLADVNVQWRLPGILPTSCATAPAPKCGLVACVALGAAVVITTFRDGHGVGVLVGALTSLLLHARPVGHEGDVVHDADGEPAVASPS